MPRERPRDQCERSNDHEVGKADLGGKNRELVHSAVYQFPIFVPREGVRPTDPVSDPPIRCPTHRSLTSPLRAERVGLLPDHGDEVPEDDVDVHEVEPPRWPEGLPDDAPRVGGIDGCAHLKPAGTVAVEALA